MIIGKGLIALQFLDCDNDKIIFFASGVSNSSETDKNQFLREENLIRETLKAHPHKLFIYFSTCSIYDSSKYNSAYVLHKLQMEEIIKEFATHYLILRISNAVGKGGNPNLLLNYLARSIKDNKVLTIHKNATRNLIDVEDIKNIVLKYIESDIHNKIINVAYTDNFKIPDIITAFQDILNIKANISIEDLGEHYSIDVHELNYKFPITDKKKYLYNLIKKYYL
ncbi:NAD-dependent epimerase/dehydratase family protein [Faecalibacter rhinopitheci]|uniref:NAD-dependent epimerase/dehydratase family protein n=1 Tax=Faecalibacter rhinopitheci TaxID=2779678 RepID=A0A8J7K4I0_9FLAO|nr:NAD-dependent epimerase/dehydratase family protein [Faecalibacter rhinopitheci]MBF0597488.1 NAD-dependent epimerase/dehydratase family protein [Faecalibacter rhinopitheci]